MKRLPAMPTFDPVAFIKQHSRNLLLTLDGHASLQQIIAEAERQQAAAKEEHDKGGPG